jgi:diguanylate cyclase (GGDEF)-like protein/PAS domain S-box-containing protein
MTYDFPNGVRKWATTLIPVFDADNVQYVVASSRDITEVETLRQENVELAERLEVMFQNHMAVMIIVDPFTGRIKDANPSACNFYGYSKDELVEMSIQDINLLAPDVVEQRRIEALKESRRYFVFPHRLKNGDVRMVDVYTSPIRRGGTMELFSIIFDVTDREMLRENLYREKELLRITLKSIGDGVVATDINGLITLQNESSDAIAGWTESEVKGRPFDEVYVLKNEMTGVVVENPVEKVLRTGKTVGLANHTVLVNKEGRHIPIADSAAPIQDAAGDMFGVVMVFRDVSQEKVHQDMILYLSYHDELTGLYNRRYAEEAIRRLNESYQSPLAIIMGDLNGLKITNDVFGHKAGDELLKRTADILRKNCREEDIVARWGGDEFLLILPRTSAESARTIMNKIMADCASDGEELVKISIALGSAVKTGEEEMQSVLREAEEWMYHQKLLDDKSYKKAIVNTLLATLYEKSYETEKHDERMNKYCTAIGKELGLSAENLNELSLFAILHDIGKIGIPHDILQKPGPLTSEEQEEMRRHPEIGFRIAQNTPELSTVAKYILSHHERWDGFGYPQGLEGESIPLLCRILAVADAYDAMTNDRVYRKAVSKEAAIEEILRNAGTQFDPDVVRIFVGLIAQGDL